MTRRRLTDALARRAKHIGSGRYTDIADTDVRGFFLRVTSGGTRSWFARHRQTGRRDFFGTWPEMSADDARERAIEIRRGAPNRKTVSRLIEHYREHHRCRGSGNPPDSNPQTRLYLDIISDTIGHLEIDAVTPDHVRQCLARKAGLPAAQNALLKRVSGIYSHAMREGWYDGRKPSDAVHRNPEQPRNRRLTVEERISILTHLLETSPPYVFGAIVIAAEYGCRISEARQLKWSDIADDTMVIRGNKQSPDRKVPILPAVRGILELQRRVGLPGDLVFSARAGKAISRTSLRNYWEKARRLAGVEDVVIHDLRHERVTHWLTSGMPPKMVARIVGHRDVKTTLRVYHDISNADVHDALLGAESHNFGVSHESHPGLETVSCEPCAS